MKRRYGPRGFDIVGISMDDNAPRVLPPFMERFQFNYPVVVGNEEVSRAFGGIFGLPTTFIVDRQGNISQRFVGYVKPHLVEEAVEALL
jgi:peroxiredoxin